MSLSILLIKNYKRKIKTNARAVSRAARIRFLPDRPDRFASFRRKEKLAVIQMKEWKVLSVLLTVETEEHIKRK